MNKFLRALAAAVIPVASIVVLASSASAAGPTEFTVGFGGTGFDGSVVVQALPDAGVIAVAKHGFGPGGSISLRRLSRQGDTVWERSIPEAASSGFYGSEFRTSLLLADGRVLFGGYSDADGSPDALFDAVLLAVDPATGASSTVTWGGPAKDMVDTIAQCADGSLYVAGGVWDGSAAPGETAALGGTDIFVTKFTVGLERSWTRQLGSRRNDTVFAARCATDGSVDLNAWAAGSVNGQGNDNYYNFFTARLDASGNTVRTIVSDLDPGEWSPQGGAYAPDGSYYVVGESNSTYPSMPCTERALGGSFVSHYSADGELLWRSILACGNLDRQIAVGASGDLFVLGESGLRVAGQQKHGGSDILIHRYSPDGIRISTRQVGSSSDDVGSGMSLDPTGHLYVGGYTKGTYDGYTAVDDWDALVMRYAVDDIAPPTTTGPVAAQASCTADTTTMLANSAAGRPIWFYGDDIGEASMAALWDYASTHNPRDFGRVIGADQDWFGECKYAGVGLGTGSGYSWHDRNVVLWMWADAVDLATARQSILNLIDSLVPPTTTVAPPMTTTTAAPAVTAPTTDSPVVAETHVVAQAPVAVGAVNAVPAPVMAAASRLPLAGPTRMVPSRAPAPRKVAPRKPATTKKTPRKVARALRVER